MPSKNSKNSRPRKSTTKTSSRKGTSSGNSSSFKSPYATSFNNGISKGTPFSVVINKICKRTGKASSVVCNSLHKAGFCDRQKFNGQWIYWPCTPGRSTATNAKNCQINMWQWFVDWCICNKICTPQQLSNHNGSQKEFMNWCRKYFARQFVGTASSSKPTSRKRSTSRISSRSTTTRKSRSTTRRRSTSTPRTYKFPTVKSRTGSRRIRRAA